jgi:hypothetical protein
MENKILILLFIIAFIAQKQDCFAQQHAKITLTKESDKSTKTYVFSEFPDAMYNCAKDEGEGQQRTQISILKTLQNNDALSVYISMMPSVTGTFILNAHDEEMGKEMQGNLNIDFNDLGGPNIGAFPDQNGKTNGSITITSYPNVGGYLTGTFKGRLKDGSDKKTGFYDVSGEFKIKRTQ